MKSIIPNNFSDPKPFIGPPKQSSDTQKRRPIIGGTKNNFTSESKTNYDSETKIKEFEIPAVHVTRLLDETKGYRGLLDNFYENGDLTDKSGYYSLDIKLDGANNIFRSFIPYKNFYSSALNFLLMSFEEKHKRTATNLDLIGKAVLFNVKNWTKQNGEEISNIEAIEFDEQAKEYKKVVRKSLVSVPKKDDEVVENADDEEDEDNEELTENIGSILDDENEDEIDEDDEDEEDDLTLSFEDDD